MQHQNLMHLLYMILTVVGLFVVVILGNYWEFIKRRSAMGGLAKSLGFEFVAKPPKQLGNAILRGSLIGPGESGVGWYDSLAYGVRHGYTFHIFNYIFQHGRSSDSQIIVCIDHKCNDLVPFSITNVSFSREIPPGRKTVTVHATKEFSINYVVTVGEGGVDAVAIPSEFLRVAALMKRVNIECLQKRLLIYRPRAVVASDQIMKWLDEAEHLSEQLNGRNS